MSAAKQASKLVLSASERDPFRRALDWYRGLPRAGRWGMTAGVVLIGFVLLDSVFWPFADQLNARADRLKLTLEGAATRAEGLPDAVAATAVAHGPNAPMVFEAQGMKKLAEAIDSVLRAKGVTKYGQDIRRAQPMNSGPASAAGAALGGQLTRTVADVSFDASPNDATAIVAALDAHESVDCITDLKLTYIPATKRVKVQMLLEKWGVSKAAPPKGSL